MDSLFDRLGWFNHYDIGDEIEGEFLYFIFCLLGVKGGDGIFTSCKAAVCSCVILYKS